MQEVSLIKTNFTNICKNFVFFRFDGWPARLYGPVWFKEIDVTQSNSASKTLTV